MITFIDLFAGIGGMRLAMEEAGAKCVFTSEIDKFACQTYAHNFGHEPAGDITKIPASEIPKHDVIVGGFPCQPFSLSGIGARKKLGNGIGTEDKKDGRLYMEFIRIAKHHRPKALLLENVKNFQFMQGGKPFMELTQELEKAGYHVFHATLDARYHVPQKRVRIYIVAISKSLHPKRPDFRFPKPGHRKEKIVGNILETRDYLPDHEIPAGTWAFLNRHLRKHMKRGNMFSFTMARLDKPARTMLAKYSENAKEILIPQPGHRPRRLTTRECARLQGFPEWFEFPCSRSQSQKQLGNAVAVPLVAEICGELLRIIS